MKNRLIFSLVACFQASLLLGSTGRPHLTSSDLAPEILPEVRFLGFIHQVREGDTIEKISQMYQVDFADLQRLNHIPMNCQLMPGTTVKIPAEAK